MSAEISGAASALAVALLSACGSEVTHPRDHRDDRVEPVPPAPCPKGQVASGGPCRTPGIPPDECGEGFVADGRGGCDAILPPEPCPDGQMAIPGETACHEVAPCAGGTWGDIPVDATTQFVDQAYAGTDSDGTAERPWTWIQAAVDAAAPGALVAIAAGSYTESLFLPDKSIRLWGKCRAEVELVTFFGAAQVNRLEVHRLALRDTTFAPVKCQDILLEGVWAHGQDSSISVNIEGQFTAQGCLFDGGDGLLLEKAQGVVEATVVRRGLVGIFAGGPMTVRRSVFEGNLAGGAIALVGAVVVEDTLMRAAGPPATGVRAFVYSSDGGQTTPCSITLRRSVIDHPGDAAIDSRGCEVILEDTDIRDAAPAEYGFGDGIKLVPQPGGEGRAQIARSRVARSARAGLVSFGSDVSFQDVLFACNAIDVDAELSGMPPALADLGGNGCGCNAPSPCSVAHAGLAPDPP